MGGFYIIGIDRCRYIEKWCSKDMIDLLSFGMFVGRVETSREWELGLGVLGEMVVRVGCGGGGVRRWWCGGEMRVVVVGDEDEVLRISFEGGCRSVDIGDSIFVIVDLEDYRMEMSETCHGVEEMDDRGYSRWMNFVLRIWRLPGG